MPSLKMLEAHFVKLDKREEVLRAHTSLRKVRQLHLKSDVLHPVVEMASNKRLFFSPDLLQAHSSKTTSAFLDVESPVKEKIVVNVVAGFKAKVKQAFGDYEALRRLHEMHHQSSETLDESLELAAEEVSVQQLVSQTKMISPTSHPVHSSTAQLNHVESIRLPLSPNNGATIVRPSTPSVTTTVTPNPKRLSQPSATRTKDTSISLKKFGSILNVLPAVIPKRPQSGGPKFSPICFTSSNKSRLTNDETLTSTIAVHRSLVVPEVATRKEFYHLQVRVVHVSQLTHWIFSVVLSDITEQNNSSGNRTLKHLFRNLTVNENKYLIFHPPSNIILSPTQDVPWGASCSDLFNHTLRIEVFATSPVQTKVVDTLVHFGMQAPTL